MTARLPPRHPPDSTSLPDDDWLDWVSVSEEPNPLTENQSALISAALRTPQGLAKAYRHLAESAALAEEFGRKGKAVASSQLAQILEENALEAADESLLLRPEFKNQEFKNQECKNQEPENHASQDAGYSERDMPAKRPWLRALRAPLAVSTMAAGLLFAVFSDGEPAPDPTPDAAALPAVAQEPRTKGRLMAPTVNVQLQARTGPLTKATFLAALAPRSKSLGQCLASQTTALKLRAKMVIGGNGLVRALSLETEGVKPNKGRRAGAACAEQVLRTGAFALHERATELSFTLEIVPAKMMAPERP